MAKAKKTELRNRITKEIMYPVTLTECILDLDLKMEETFDWYEGN